MQESVLTFQGYRPIGASGAAANKSGALSGEGASCPVELVLLLKRI